MRYHISNRSLAIEVNEVGAELCSFKDLSTNTELLWQAGPAWERHAPILFPMVGQVKDNEYQVAGQTYSMTRHGFARHSTFQLHDSSDQHLVFLLSDSAESREQYPFHFRFLVSYFLIGKKLRITYSVENPASSDMWFSVGAHPAFKCPILETESYHDYDLIFEKQETKETNLLKDGLFDGQTAPMLNNQSVLRVTHELFSRDALVFHDLESDWIELKSRVSGKGVRLTAIDWPYYGIWAKTNGDFVCLEPWYGRSDDTDVSGDWTEKPGIIQLGGAQTWSAFYEIEAL